MIKNNQIKTKILFVIESLALAGSEKSLVALLNNLNSARYDIDLQLFSYEGELSKFLPSYVNILPPLEYTQFSAQKWSVKVQQVFLNNKLPYLKSMLTYSLALRQRKRNHTEIAKLYWEKVHSAYKKQPQKYDVAIAYAQGVPTFYVIDKITADKKVAWVNANVEFTDLNLNFQEKFYERYDSIVAVSKTTREHFVTIFPAFSNKMYFIPDMIDYRTIVKMAESRIPGYKANIFNILTVARLEKGMKGLDIAISAAKILRDQKIIFHWYFLGKGSYLGEMISFIKEHQLENYVTLLGTTANPYPFFKAADLYVQTSRSESYGISIAEARLLNVPIVTTRFDSVFVQMVEDKNGLVVDVNAEAVALAIIRLMTDKELYNSIVEYLKAEEKENTETVVLFDELIDTI